MIAYSPLSSVFRALCDSARYARLFFITPALTVPLGDCASGAAFAAKKQTGFSSLAAPNIVLPTVGVVIF